MPEERKLVTVLFADIVGSTGLAGGHDPEVVRGTLAKTFARMREILVAHGATVEKFIGDAVMAVFGVPLAHEDDAFRGVRAAFALRDAVAELNATAMLRLALRLGLNTGEVVAGGGEGGEFLVTGQPVIVGERLQGSAEPGEVLVGALTRQLTESRVEFGSPRRVEAKGIGNITAWPAVALRSRADPMRHVRAPLVDRVAEIGLLAQTYERVVSERRPYLVTIYGVGGAGKSRLTHELIKQVGGATVRGGRCIAYGEGITFFPVQEILRIDAGIEAPDSAEEALAKLDQTVGPLFERLEDGDAIGRRLSVLAGLASVSSALGDAPADSVGQELEWALRRYLARRAKEGPLILVIEDLHWAEPALLDLIEHIAEWTPGPLLLLCLARPDLLATRPSWGGGKMNAMALSLQPLAAEDTRRLAAALLPAERASMIDEVVRRSDGNPLYVEEIVRHVLQSEQPPSALPATLHGLVAARLDAAPLEIRTLLRRASVVGKIFWADALIDLGEDADVLSRRLLEAQRRDFVIEVGERGPGGGSAYRFDHVVTRDVAYSSVPKSERANLHDRFGRWLEGVAGERRAEYAEVVAYHAEQAYLLAREIDLASAPALGSRAFALLLGAARASRLRTDPAASALFHRAAAVGEGCGVAREVLVEARGYAATGRLRQEGSSEALAEVQRVLAEARALGPSEVLSVLLTWTALYAFYDDPDHARSLHAEAVHVARAVGDPRLIATALRASAELAGSLGHVDEQRRILADARGLLIQNGGRHPLSRVLLDLAENAMRTGDFAAARRLLDEAVPLARDVIGRILANKAEAQYRLAIGDPAGALSMATEALAAARELGAPLAVVWASSVLGAVLRERGELDSARAVLEEGLRSARPTAANVVLVQLRCELAQSCLALDDVRTARHHAEDACAARVTEMATLAAARTTLALVLAAERRPEEADALFRDATALLEPTGLQSDLAEVRRRRAVFLLAEGRDLEARPLLEAVRDFYADPLATRRRAEIEALSR